MNRMKKIIMMMIQKYDTLYNIIGSLIDLYITGGCCKMWYNKCKNSNTNQNIYHYDYII